MSSSLAAVCVCKPTPPPVNIAILLLLHDEEESDICLYFLWAAGFYFIRPIPLCKCAFHLNRHMLMFAECACVLGPLVHVFQILHALVKQAVESSLMANQIRMRRRVTAQAD